MMRRRCHNCKSLLRVWDMRCPCCHVSAIRLLHLLAAGVFSLTVAFYLLVTVR
jgi:hypothetical protein